MSSGAFRDLPVSWAARTESPEGKTSPEELIAAAHASCFEMALSGALARGGTPPERLDVTAEVTFDKLEAGWRVVSSALTVVGRVPGLDAAGFRAAAEGDPRRLPGVGRAQGQRRPVGRGDARGVTASASPGGSARVRIRAGLSTVIWRMAASGMPASRSRGRNRSIR